MIYVASCAIAIADIARADEAISDNEISQRLVGSWQPASDDVLFASAPQSLKKLRFVEHFDESGRGDAFVYSDSNCHRLLLESKFAWTVRGGILIARHPDGRISKDRILNITHDSLLMLLMVDNLKEHRVRTSECPSHEGS
jgi:hypothetical protein